MGKCVLQIIDNNIFKGYMPLVVLGHNPSREVEPLQRRKLQGSIDRLQGIDQFYQIIHSCMKSLSIRQACLACACACLSLSLVSSGHLPWAGNVYTLCIYPALAAMTGGWNDVKASKFISCWKEQCVQIWEAIECRHNVHNLGAIQPKVCMTKVGDIQIML